MWQVVFPKILFEDLNTFLFSTMPNENGCFLLANSYRTKDRRKVILITGIVKPSENSWNNTGEHALEPNSSFINDAVVMADANNQSLIFVHTHPNSLHPPKFSIIDEKSNRRIFANLSQIIPDRPLGSFVFSEQGVYGKIFHDGLTREVSNFKISGSIISDIPTVGKDTNLCDIDSKFDRQIRAIGKQNQNRIQDMIVTIVGVGGTGSPLAVQLARMGVKKLQIIDRDIIDKTNLPRIYGSKEKDVGKPKVTVLKKYIESFSKTKVESLRVDITKQNILGDLLNSDVIFACTDNLSSRSILNDISIQYYIPLIDVGCRIHLGKDGSISQAIAKVQTVTPDNACLWCTGTLDGKIILQEESLSSEDKKRLAKEGYYDDVEKQPSIISLTTVASSMAVNKLLSLLGVFGNNYNSRTQIEIKENFMIDDNPEIKTDCICSKRKGKASEREIVCQI